MPQNTPHSSGYNNGYNNDFTDEDARRLVYIACSPDLSLHTCRWVEAGAQCNVSVQGDYLPSHFRGYHGIYTTPHHLDNSSGCLCKWDGCSDASTFTEDGLLRHIQEKHLQWRWSCPNCRAVYLARPQRDAHYVLCLSLITGARKEHLTRSWGATGSD